MVNTDRINGSELSNYIIQSFKETSNMLVICYAACIHSVLQLVSYTIYPIIYMFGGISFQNSCNNIIYFMLSKSRSKDNDLKYPELKSWIKMNIRDPYWNLGNYLIGILQILALPHYTRFNSPIHVISFRKFIMKFLMYILTLSLYQFRWEMFTAWNLIKDVL